MKTKIKRWSLFFIVISTLLSACKKEEETETLQTDPYNDYSFTATINGNEFEAKRKREGWYDSGIPINFVVGYESKYRRMSAKDPDFPGRLTIEFPNGFSKGETYTIGQSSAATYHETWVNAWFSHNNVLHYSHDNSGTVTITDISEDGRVIKGTFEMTLYHEDYPQNDHILEVTNGRFWINLDKIPDH